MWVLSACSDPPAQERDFSKESDEVVSAASAAGDRGAQIEQTRRDQARLLEEANRKAQEQTAFQAAVASGDDTRIFALADQGNPYALFYRAEQHLSSGDPGMWSLGRADAEAAAAGGAPDAQLWVGYRMSQGMEGYPWKPSSGLRLVEQAAKQGHAQAMYTLGQLYEQDAPMQDLKLARDWYTRAAAAGVTEAKEALAGLDR
jgi:TPR repeat protein